MIIANTSRILLATFVLHDSIYKLFFKTIHLMTIPLEYCVILSEKQVQPLARNPDPGKAEAVFAKSTEIMHTSEDLGIYMSGSSRFSIKPGVSRTSG